MKKNNEKSLCFVIMPFREEYEPIYNKIKDAVKKENYKCKRADEVDKGPITKTIFEHIFQAKAIVADLTDSNPNVFYELGVAHTLGRKTILISQEKKIPFDVSGDFVIKYENTIEGGDKLYKELTRLLKHLMVGGVIDNPAQMFLPRTPEQEKIDNLAEKSKEITLALAKSRLLEVKIIFEEFGKYDTELGEDLKRDIENWEKILEIKRG